MARFFAFFTLFHLSLTFFDRRFPYFEKVVRSVSLLQLFEGTEKPFQLFLGFVYYLVLSIISMVFFSLN